MATRLLPAGRARDRWRRELVAELYGLTRAGQARHTLGVLRRAPALRAAGHASDHPHLKEDVMRKPLRCRVSLHHWRTASADDGTRFRRCSRCGKEEPFGDSGHWAGGVGHAAG